MKLLYISALSGHQAISPGRCPGYWVIGLSGRPKANPNVELLDHKLLAVLDVDALCRRLAIELAATEIVPCLMVNGQW